MAAGVHYTLVRLESVFATDRALNLLLLFLLK